MSRMDGWIRTLLPAAALLAFTNSQASAQSLQFNAAGETAGDDIHVLYGEVGLVEAGLGFRPVGTLGGYTVFHDGTQSWGITPSIGLRYTAAEAFTQFQVGYAIRGNNGTPLFGGTQDGIYTALQTEYWGTGPLWASGIANYNVGGDYLWSRARVGADVLTMGQGTVGLGAEGTFQSERVLDAAPPGAPSFRATQVGPVLRWTMRPQGPTFHAGGGWKETRFAGERDDTWYLRAEVFVR